jgi:hypothetical protein
MASWFETRGIAALLTMRVLIPDERFALTEGAHENHKTVS